MIVKRLTKHTKQPFYLKYSEVHKYRPLTIDELQELDRIGRYFDVKVGEFIGTFISVCVRSSIHFNHSKDKLIFIS